MKKGFFIGVIASAFCAWTAPAKDFTGFTAASAKTEQQYELRYDSLLSAPEIGSLIKDLSAHPHHVGSAWDAHNAQYILQKYRDWGYDAHIDTFYALFPTPKTRELEMIAPGKFKAGLAEKPLKEDPTSSQTSEQLPSYNCYSADGDVTGELVYVNFGIPEDYERLEQLGIDVKGKIVIARYGAAWRGIKPRLAQEHGAIGCIIYSDPKEDGYYQEDVYPRGPMKNEYGVQRGSVLDMPLYPGDPLTPGWGDTKNAKRLDRKNVKNLLKIPVLPISYSDAKPFLEALTGPVAPEGWRGALPFTYHIGPGPVKVHLKLEFNWDTKPVLDVVATLKGSEYPDQWVIRGNHYDAWVNGACDPISGQAAMLEQAKCMGQLAEAGMRPKRTVVFCSWDGEEPGLLGSTEWVETNAAELQQKAVAYINTDDMGRGFLGVGGSHTLQQLTNEVAADVQDPEMKISVLERWRAQKLAGTADAKARKDFMASPTMKIDALGSGSDFSSFLQHVGVASMDVGYGGEDMDGQYHSIYDSYAEYVRFKDPGFHYGVVLAETAGRLMMRLANADVLPFNFTDFYTTLNGYAKDLIKKTDEMRTSTEVNNQLLKDHIYTYASDPTKAFIPPAPKSEVPFLDFSPLQNAMLALKKSVDVCQPLIDNADNQSLEVLKQLNVLIFQSERKLLLDKGLPIRPWYKHAIYAPGYFTGYGVKTLPGIREAIENRDWKLAQQQITEAANAINAYTQQVNAVAELLKPR